MKLKYIWQYLMVTMVCSLGLACGESTLFRGKHDRLSPHDERSGGTASRGPLITEVKDSKETTAAADATAKPGAAVDPDLPTPPAEVKLSKIFEIPGAKPEEMEALNKCLASFGQDTFPQKITNFKRMTAQIVIGGTATPIDDQLSTPEPELVLIGAGANYGSNVTYNMLNRNGYYCMTLDVNIKSFLTINLHCHAQVADSAVAVQVNSTTNGSPSTVGVHVNSLVKVQDVRPDGDVCIR